MKQRTSSQDRKYVFKPSVLASVGLLLSVVGGCVPDTDDGPSHRESTLVAGLPADSTFDAPIGKSTRIWIKTIPNSPCVLSGNGADPSAGLALDSDDDGFVNASVVPDKTIPGTIENYTIVCTNKANEPLSFPLRIHIVDAAASVSKANVPATVAGTLRPPLRLDELSLSTAELVARGYPPRPDATNQPEAYTAWLTDVLSPARRVSSKVIRHPGVFNYTIGNPSWSGHIVHQVGTQYVQAEAGWIVPVVATGQPSGYRMAIWTGIDGFFTSAPGLIQLGTNALTYQVFKGHFATYSAWIEHLPADQVGIPVTVSAGDTIVTLVWEGDSAGNLNPSGGYAWFYLRNITNNQTYEGSISNSNGGAFVGNSAEWIVERPEVNGAIVPLAQYATFDMQNCLAWDPLYAQHTWSTDSFDDAAMRNDADTFTLSDDSEVDSYTLQFVWHASQ